MEKNASWWLRLRTHPLDAWVIAEFMATELRGGGAWERGGWGDAVCFSSANIIKRRRRRRRSGGKERDAVENGQQAGRGSEHI
jgi:hypothetical protein